MSNVHFGRRIVVRQASGISSRLDGFVDKIMRVDSPFRIFLGIKVL